jgi:hypothetical protein
MRCVACLVGADCGDGGVCNAVAMTCAPACTELAACCPLVNAANMSLGAACMETVTGANNGACASLLAESTAFCP